MYVVKDENFLGLYTEATGGSIYAITHETEFEMVTECLLMLDSVIELYFVRVE